MPRFDEFNFQLEKKDYFIGLDFGTERSLFAFKHKNGLQVILPQRQVYRRGIPSLFWYKKNSPEYNELPSEMTCGDVENYSALINDPKGVITSIKMKLTEDKITLHEKEYTPHYIATEIVKKIIAISQETLSSMGMKDINLLDRVVVGVPVRFDCYKREILSTIMKTAGIQEVQLLAEPMAAALYYAHSQKKNFNKVLVFDMGAGTFDTAILVKNENPTSNNPYPFTIPAFDGSEEAGNKLDEEMTDLIIKKLETESGSFNIEALKNPNTSDYLQLKETARQAKEALSDAIIKTVLVTGNTFGYHQLSVTRSEYETVISPLIDSAITKAAKVLETAGVVGDKDLTILMVGGSSYIPLIRKKLVEKFSWLPEENIIQQLPDQAVALGCAIFGQFPDAFSRKVAYGYGVETYYNDNLILDVTVPANIKLPYQMTSKYVTRYEGQTSVLFKVYEIADAAKGKLEISRGKYSNIEIIHNFGKSVQKGTEVTLTTEIDESGLMKLSINDNGISSEHTTISHNLGITTYVI